MNSKATFTRVIAIMLLVVMTMSMASCDSLQAIIGGNSHTHNFVGGECVCGETDPNYVCEHYFVNGVCVECGEKKPAPHEHNYVDGKCECGESDPNYDPNHQHNFVEGKCECGESDPDYKPEYKTITIAEALEIAAANPDGTTELYYITATVKTMKNASYGEMYIEDETGEIYVYGTRGEDGETFFDKLPERPVKGDKVLLLCQLSQYKGESQVKLARLISFEHVEVDISDLTAYEEMTIAAARDAEAGKLLRVSGVVAQITYANGKVPSGVILVDGTSSIYVYSNDLAGQVSIGNTVEIAAEKTYYVLSSEQSNADKFGYKGSNQLDNVIVISNDKGSTDFDKSWITESTVKTIMDTPVTEDITTKIFKVNALVKKVPGNGFTNYYIDDIDGVTGSYVYTQCNGSDFTWLDEFDGKICTVYIVALNAKSSTSGCVWRFLPVAVSDDGYTFDTTKAAEYAVKYHGVGQFLSKYTGDPILKLISSVSSELLGFENATLSYYSDNVPVVSFSTDIDGDTVLHCEKTGTANITITGTYNGITYSQTIEITVEVTTEEIDSISIADAIAKEVGEEVIIRGIVGPSLVNKSGFYLFDESGMIAVTVEASLFAEIAIGNEVVLKGIRDMWHGEGATYGQICVTNATVEANYYGNHDYLTISPISDKDLEYFYNLDEQDMSETTKLYTLTATVTVEESAYYTNIYLVDGDIKVRLYCSSANQYNWLKAFAGQEVTIEIAPCNWNSKNYYTGCVLAVVNEDGTKVLNTLNFN